MIILGEKEVKDKMISVRQQGKGDLGQFTVENFQILLKVL